MTEWARVDGGGWTLVDTTGWARVDGGGWTLVDATGWALVEKDRVSVEVEMGDR